MCSQHQVKKKTKKNKRKNNSNDNKKAWYRLKALEGSPWLVISQVHPCKIRQDIQVWETFFFSLISKESDCTQTVNCFFFSSLIKTYRSLCVAKNTWRLGWNSVISIQPSRHDSSGPVFCHVTKQSLIIAFTPLQLLVHCPFLAAPQLFHHRPCNVITILQGIQPAPGIKACLGLSLLIYRRNCQIPMFNMLFRCKRRIHISSSTKMCIFLLHLRGIHLLKAYLELSARTARLSEWRLSINAASQGGLNNANCTCLDGSMLKADIPHLIQRCALLGFGTAG